MSYPLLERINAPGEIKNLPADEMPALCEEIRQFLIKSVSETGGHLSSNLGVVELTVALHRVLDFPQDKLLFDVGHQCYTHKLLTGRRAGFAQLRRKNGISGFPSPEESSCDAFIAGHGQRCAVHGHRHRPGQKAQKRAGQGRGHCGRWRLYGRHGL